MARKSKKETDSPKKDPEENVDQEKQDDQNKTIPYLKLFRFADAFDIIALIIGSLAALGHGALTPLFVIFFGDVLDEFGPNSTGSLSDAVSTVALYILYVACAGLVLSYFQVMFWTLAAQRQSLRIRKLYFQALCRQEMAWYDTHSTAALSSRVSADVPKIQEGMGDKAASFLQYFGMFLAGFIVGFVYGWKLTLVILSVVPLIAIGGAVMSKFVGEATSGGTAFYADAGAVADEVLRMIRTIIAFGTQSKEIERYYRELDKACKEGEKAGRIQGIGMGFTMFVIFAAYALTFLYGGKLVRDGELTAGDVITVFFSVMIGAMSIGQAAPNISAMAGAQGAAYHIFQVIDRESQIDSLSTEGQTPKTVGGAISMRNVHFAYPTRTHEPVLNGLTLDIHPKETVALVGESGCGKSTCLGLVERFYDPDQGSVSLDGVELKSLNVQWLRERIALVEQTPVLFPTTIYENISLGKDGATREEVIEAAKQANAHDFIESFPDKYDTLVGDSGTQMSGGQRQRIAIARALIKNPDILLLDEATSALDNQSEAVVKDALDRASQGRTTIIIAHRLSTVLDSDRIIVIGDGKVVEEGKPQDLVDKGGSFARMVAAQQGQSAEGAKLAVTSDKPSMDSTDASTGVLTTQSERTVESKLDFENFNGADSDEKKKKRKKKDKKAVGMGADAELSEEIRKKYEEETPEVDASMFKWVSGINRPERCYMIWGIIGAVCEGLVWPVYAILLADVLGEMLGNNDPDIVLYWCLGFLGTAVFMFITQIFKFWFLAIAGERLTKRLRQKTFYAMVNKEVAWFDMPQHERGILTTRLANDAHAVRGILGDRLGITCMSLTTIFVSIAVSVGFCWRVGLVVLACVPVVGIGGYFQFKMITGFASSKDFELSGKFASQAVENIRTVVALGRLDNFVRDYYSTLVAPSKKMRVTAQVQGIAFGFTEFCLFAIWALAFWYGATVVEDGFCDFDGMFKAIMAIVFMGIIVGQLSSLAPDAAKANDSAKRLYHLITTQAEEEANKPKKGSPPITGEVEFKDVQFTYPSRPDAPVLQGLSFKVEPGHTLALVGHSGCGKSTTVSLIEKFYNIDGGKILIDGNELDEIDETHLRKHMALVTQQPELFACSISDNIKYGLDHDATDNEVVKAAQLANAAQFVDEFEKKFETTVGEKGAQLSGGQRQRIAIARALIRSDNIKILLLDEASAALDSESERLVHEALETASRGRTTIIIAHRLSTIKNADSIAVIDGGRVVEQGSHSELMREKGAYYELVNRQDLFMADDDDHHDNHDNNDTSSTEEESAKQDDVKFDDDHQNDVEEIAIDESLV